MMHMWTSFMDYFVLFHQGRFVFVSKNLFLVRPSSLVGGHIGKMFEIFLNNLLFSQHIRIVGCYYSAIYLILLYRTFCKILGSTG